MKSKPIFKPLIAKAPSEITINKTEIMPVM
ncbi:Uncharacterised protein [Vibrio cholerae]|nr:Uncharacterised protein [Vibrio cholerae]